MVKIVMVSDLKMSTSADDIIKTHALGTCLGITIYDKKAKVGGLLHFQLPSSRKNPDRAIQHPYMFADTAIPLMFKKAYDLGASKRDIDVKVAGGGTPMKANNMFEIGRRNYLFMKKLFWKNNIFISAERIGGSDPVTMWLEMETGKTFLKINNRVTEMPTGELSHIA